MPPLLHASRESLCLICSALRFDRSEHGDLSPGSTKAALGISATAFEIGLDNNGVGKPHCSAFFIVLITVQKEEKQEIAQISSLRFHLASRVPQQIKLKWAPSWLLHCHAELPWAPSPPALLRVIMLSKCSKQAGWGKHMCFPTGQVSQLGRTQK